MTSVIINKRMLTQITSSLKIGRSREWGREKKKWAKRSC